MREDLEVIDVLADDDRLTLEEKLKWVQTADAAFRVLKESKALRRVDWVGLDRYARGLGKRIFVICDQRTQAPEAAAAGIAVHDMQMISQPDFSPWRGKQLKKRFAAADRKAVSPDHESLRQRYEREVSNAARKPSRIAWILALLLAGLLVYALMHNSLIMFFESVIPGRSGLGIWMF